MTADVAGFLLAQLDADETVARAATQGAWRSVRGGIALRNVGSTFRILRDEGLTDENARHIALHDPAFELDRIAADRAVVKLHKPAAWYSDPLMTIVSDIRCDSEDDKLYPCPTLLALAQPYRGRAGWRDEWTVA